MGGVSAEREISLKSGNAIHNALKTLGYNVVSIDVGHDICRVLEKEKVDIAFLSLHGGHGENGAFQGMLEVLGSPPARPVPLPTCFAAPNLHCFPARPPQL